MPGVHQRSVLLNQSQSLKNKILKLKMSTKVDQFHTRSR